MMWRATTGLIALTLSAPLVAAEAVDVSLRPEESLRPA